MERKKNSLGISGTIIVSFADPKTAEAAFLSIKNEGYSNERCDASSRLLSKEIHIRINAKDIVSFRATVNSLLRSLQVIESIEMSMR